MDKITKALNKLSKSERAVLKKILTRIDKWDIAGLDIKRLKGHKNIFRIRKGKIRVIFSKDLNNQIRVLTVERRNDNTYREY